ncbi:hypothetical protein CDG77_12620 [Nostoc sp. 'Peltigera membranacea cyanobiont' 213]|uniref:hypothetical protein n=1 Tax=unclassified Nostoc TaxID=2593658 RepID=UPI000B951C6A|nr:MULTISPECIES: hypothetical protein [unclassified Nostoc]OYD94099.1 hypothetical protein CDG77_12620 [Nostoc sp. 'Peltigera membranacea cyanobiont' 213]
MERRKILIATKTYPSINTKYQETGKHLTESKYTWRLEIARQLLMGETPKTALAWLYKPSPPARTQGI